MSYDEEDTMIADDTELGDDEELLDLPEEPLDIPGDDEYDPEDRYH